jgi:hypothetical protein
MKNIIKNTAVAIIIAAAIGSATSCKKETVNPTPTTTVETQNLSFNINPVIGSAPLNYSSIFTTTTGERFTLSMFRYYLSNIRLIKSDGSEYLISNKYLLVTPSTTNYDLGKVPVGDYKGLKFSVGIDSITNHGDPTVYPVTNPLAIQSPGINWSWNAGYIFMMIEGSCDTTVANTDTLTYGQFSHGMFFHIGTDMFYKNVDLSTSAFSVTSSAAKAITIKTNLNTFFTNINLKTENQTHTLMGGMALATKGATNIPNMFTIVP